MGPAQVSDQVQALPLERIQSHTCRSIQEIEVLAVTGQMDSLMKRDIRDDGVGSRCLSQEGWNPRLGLNLVFISCGESADAVTTPNRTQCPNLYSPDLYCPFKCSALFCPLLIRRIEKFDSSSSAVLCNTTDFSSQDLQRFEGGAEQIIKMSCSN